MDIQSITSWLGGFNMFNVAATGAAIFVFISNWWILILLGFVWLVARSGSPDVSRDSGSKDEHKSKPDKKVKNLPTKDEVVKMVTDLYLK